MTPPPTRAFVLSPASLRGARGRRVLAGASAAPFRASLQAGDAVPLGDVYEYISSLYYRGKRAYARCFGGRTEGGPAVFVVTPTVGLLPDGESVRLADLRGFANVDIDSTDPVYREELARSARDLSDAIGPAGEVVLLGSIASTKYLDPLAEVFADRLLVPRTFAGRGDMSRGGLLLRAVEDREELDYVPALSASRHGPRPPRLEPRTRAGRASRAGPTPRGSSDS